MSGLRLLVTLVGLVLLWQAIVWLSGVPAFILPGPLLVIIGSTLSVANSAGARPSTDTAQGL